MELLARFVEILLGRFEIGEGRFGTFDYTNKVHFLGYLAEEMVRCNKFALREIEFYDFLRNYGSKYDLQIDGLRLMNLLAGSRVLAHDEGKIFFRYRAFFEYFVARRMDDSDEFRDFILEELRYLSFPNEVEYFSGLRRDRQWLVELLATRFDEIANRLHEESGWNPDVAVFDDLQQLIPEFTSEAGAAIERAMTAGIPTHDERDALRDREAPKNLGKDQSISKALVSDVATQWTGALVLYSRVVRNSELIPAEVKKKHVDNCLHKWGQMTMHAIMLVPEIARHRDIHVHGVRYVVAGGQKLNEVQSMFTLFPRMPLAIADTMVKNLATEKLELVVGRVLKESNPKIVDFLGCSLLVDLRSEKAYEHLGRLIGQLGPNSYLLEALLLKLKNFYFRNVYDERESAAVRRIVAELVAKLKNPKTGRERKRVAAAEVQSLSKVSLRQRMARRRSRDEL